MRIETDSDRCVGAAQCVLAAPTVFDQGEDGVIRVLQPKPADADKPSVRHAEDWCPARVISLIEDQPGQA
jgi:ferredoxin